MAYYLSYVEMNDNHAALMLPEHKNPSEPTKIIQEIGFIYEEDHFFLSKVNGIVNNDENISRLLYGRSTGKHITYEISESEKDHFSKIIERDKLLKNTPSYQTLTHNCKTYAMNVFKEIGIIDAKHLGNTFIQRPGTSNSLLHPLRKDELSCPEKEKFLLSLDTILNNLEQNLKECSKRKLSQSDNEVIKKSQDLIPTLKKIKHKIDFSNDCRIQFRSLLTSITSIDEFDPKIEESAIQLEELLNKELKAKLPAPFFWKTAPIIADRVDLSKFLEGEKELYLLKIKQHELSEGLDYLLKLLQKESRKSIDKNMSDECDALMKLISDKQNEIQAETKAFHDSLSDKKDIQHVCIEQNKKLNAIIDKLESDISKFQPKSPITTSSLVKFIHALLSYLKKDYFVLDHSANQSLAKSISNLRHSTDSKYNQRSRISSVSVGVYKKPETIKGNQNPANDTAMPIANEMKTSRRRT